eukprot:jgi/Tetstr1/464457/TSEL_000825.t1
MAQHGSLARLQSAICRPPRVPSVLGASRMMERHAAAAAAKVISRLSHYGAPVRGARLLSAAAGSDNGSGEAGGDAAGEGGALASVEELPEGWEEVSGAGRVVTYDLQKEATDSYLSYAMSVIVGRALPDVRDGLKPVHRRILFAMHELGLSSSKPFRKCARVVGEVLGKYHPHGDTAVYDALVRLAQDFSMRAPLVDGHGNFGSLDNDPPAAMRYTECRLHRLAMASLLTDLDCDTVEFAPNFDGSQMEPLVLPARVPLLLVNGASGIAVGIATKIPPHNLGEVVAGLRAMIADPDISSAELMRYIPGPDFPTGGTMLAGAGLADAYAAGRGGVTLRASVAVESPEEGSKRRRRSDRELLVITEIPYQTNKADLVQKIAELVDNRIIDGISDVRDESDRDGMRVVVELKRSAVPELVLNQLFHHTRLQVRFSCNMVALVDGQPMCLGLRDFLHHFLEWRCDVITRRSAFKAKQARKRLHLVEGYMAVLLDVDRAVQVIRSGSDPADAGLKLQDAFGLSAEQTRGVLAMTLGRLTRLETDKLAKESAELAATIADLDDLVSSRERLLGVVESEAMEVEKQFGTPRRTRIVADASGDGGVIQVQDIIPNDESLVTFSRRGYVKRMASDTFSVQARGGQGKAAARLKDDDAMESVVRLRNHDHMIFFSNQGAVYTVRAYDIPEAKRTALGTPITSIISLPAGSSVTAMINTASFKEEDFLLLATKNGLIKRVPMADFATVRSNGRAAMALAEGDSLDFVEKAPAGSSILTVSSTAHLLHFPVDLVRVTKGRQTKGVKSMKLVGGERVVGMTVLPPELEVLGDNAAAQDFEDDEEGAENPLDGAPWVLFVTKKGMGKRLGVRRFRKMSRAQKGIIALRLAPGDALASMHVVGAAAEGADASSAEALGDALLATANGLMQRVAIQDFPLFKGRQTRGNIVMRMKDPADEVIGVTLAGSHSAVDED